MLKNMYKWLHDVTLSNDRAAMPIAGYPGAELTGAGIVDIVKNAKSQYECIKALAGRFPSAAAMTFMDLSVEAEAFGCPVKFSDREAPTITANIVNDRASIEALKVPEVGADAGRTMEYLNAAFLASKEIHDRPVFGGVIGPFSLAVRIANMTCAMLMAKREKELLHTLVAKCAEFIKQYVLAFKGTGVNGIIMAEPAAGLLSPDLCQEFSSDYIRKIVGEVQDANFIIILHNCGHTEKLVKSLLTTGCRAFHFGNSVDMAEIMPQIPWGNVAFGNLDPANIMKLGTPDQIEKSTMELLYKTANYKNFVLSTGCDIPAGTSLENIQAIYNAVEMFNRKTIKYIA
jgi:uroporphyrinogen decarboxylase